ncbi:MAG: nicotinate phosphoribosyltransferase, partial [Caldilineaceae bacterium]|nr:nicotinate phosphoribosyltransferase [Caldilineaceae bacterium]
WLLDWMQRSRFLPTDIEYLRSQHDSAGRRLFADDFLAWLVEHGHFGQITLHAIPEGRVVHPNMPLTVVEGPLAMAQILETPLLAHLNYQTLVATKAARMVESGRGGPVLEFGLRRAHEKGANAGARGALVGGANYTSNVGVSRVVGLPAKGTHAHSLVQLYMALGLGELAAFQAYADLYPDDCLLLVDTVDTLQSGMPHAIKVFEGLRRKGHKPVGVRLDSGDLAYLSIQAAKMLDEAGFDDTSIVLSGDLDELVIWQIITQISEEAPRYDVEPDQLINRLVYGVGTRLITSWGEPALGGVYKLVAVRENGHWNSAIKVSESPAKTPNPGRKKLWRLYDQRGKATADLQTLDSENPQEADHITIRHPSDHTKYRTLHRASISRFESLLTPILAEGKQVYDLPGLDEIRARRIADIEALDPGIRRLINPHIYHVSLSQKLWDLKQELIEAAMRQNV